MAAVQQYILNTVSIRNIQFIRYTESISEILTILKNRLIPISQSKKIITISNYILAKAWNNKIGIEEQIENFEQVYKAILRLALAEVTDERPLYDFIYTIQNFNAGFASREEGKLDDILIIGKVDANGKVQLLKISALIDRFRNHQRYSEVQRTTTISTVSYSIFAMLDSKNEYSEKAYMYRGIYKQKECNYLIPKNRSIIWAGKPATFKLINKKIEASKTNRSYPKSFKQWIIDNFKYDSWEVVAKNEKNNTTKGYDRADNSIGLAAIYSTNVSRGVMRLVA